jgi:ELWxxDGT repeat protein
VDGFTTLNDTLYFSGNTDSWLDSDGILLWTSDGTDAGTTIVKDMVPDMRYDQINSRLFTLNNHIFYSSVTTNGNNDNFIWKSDGTEGGTVRLLDIYGWDWNGGDGEINNMVPMGSHLYFQGIDQTYNDSLWISDGTTAGTKKLKTICADGCDIRNLTAVNDTLFFNTYYKKELWKSDGTEAGTVKITLSAAGTVDNLIACNDKLYLTISNNLYSSDGTTDGTVRITEFGGIIGYFSPGPNIFVHSMFSFNDILYIKTVNNDTNQYSLYALNPAESNDAIIVNSLSYDSLNVAPYLLEDALVYTTDDGTNTEMWKYSITDGNVLIKSNSK